MTLQLGPFRTPVAGFRRFSVADYHRLIDLGFLTETDNFELLEGYLVQKMSRNPPHDGNLHKFLKTLLRCVSAGWEVRIQGAVTLADSEPEPDLAIVRSDPREYLTRHPEPPDFGVVIEVSNSTLEFDRLDKSRIYARAGIPEYWIVNVVDGQVEVYTSPSGPTADPAYANRRDYRPGDAVPLVLDGTTVAQLAVSEIIG